MKTLPKLALRLGMGTGLIIVAAFYLLFFSTRPPLTIDPATLVGDGSTVNYCELPVLDGRGKLVQSFGSR